MTRARQQSPQGEFNEVVLALLAGAALFVSLLTTAALGRTLAPSDFGFWVLVASVLALAKELTDLGSGTVVSGWIAAEPDRRLRLIGDLIGLRLAMALPICLGCLVLSLLQDGWAQRAVIALAAAVVPLLPLGAMNAEFQARGDPVTPALVTLLGQGAVLGVSLALVSAAADPVVLGLVLVAREAATAVSLWVLGSLRLAAWPRPSWGTARLLRSIGSYGGAALCLGVAVQGSPILVAVAVGPETLADYAASFRLVAPLMALQWALAAPLTPLLARLDRHDPHGANGRAAQAIWMSIGVCGVVLVGGYDLSDTALSAVYGAEAGARYPAAVLRWLAVGLGATVVFANAAAILLARHRIGAIFMLAAGCLIGSAAGAAVLVPALGSTGMALALAVAVGVAAMAGTGLVMRPAWDDSWRFCIMLLPAAGVALMNRLVAAGGWNTLVFGGVVLVLALLAAWRLSRLIPVPRLGSAAA